MMNIEAIENLINEMTAELQEANTIMDELECDYESARKTYNDAIDAFDNGTITEEEHNTILYAFDALFVRYHAQLEKIEKLEKAIYKLQLFNEDYTILCNWERDTEAIIAQV